MIEQRTLDRRKRDIAMNRIADPPRSQLPRHDAILAAPSDAQLSRDDSTPPTPAR
jgi:hypothetical protein